ATDADPFSASVAIHAVPALLTSAAAALAALTSAHACNCSSIVRLQCAARLMSIGGAFSWNSELPSGRNPFWIRDEALAGLGLHVGDAVSVDTRAEPRNGDLVVVEAEVDGDSLRTARRFFLLDELIRLEAVSDGVEPLELPAEAVMVMGVIVARLHFSTSSAPPIEEPL